MGDKPSGGLGDGSPPAGSEAVPQWGSKNLKTKVKSRLGLKIQTQMLMNHVYYITQSAVFSLAQLKKVYTTKINKYKIK